MKLKLLLLVALVASFVAISPAGADHDLVYAPCDPEDTRSVDERVWYIDYQSGVILRYDDPWWGERPGMMGYTNWHFQCGLGMTGVWQAAPILPQPHPPDYVIDTRSPAVVCDAATGYTRMGAVEIEQRVNALIPDGIDLNSLTITDTGIIIAGTPSPMLVEAGIIREWAVDHNGTSRHYLDLYWEYKFTHLPNETFWVAGCMATPVEPPPHTPSSSSTSTTSTTTSAPSVVTTTTTQAPSTTTSTTTLVPTPTVYDEPPLPPLDNDPIPGVDTSTDVDNVIVTLDPSYDLYDAEWDGWPFEITVRLLEQRYVPNTPDRRHFPMSVAVDYLRGGGMIGGLDEIWEWP